MRNKNWRKYLFQVMLMTCALVFSSCDDDDTGNIALDDDVSGPTTPYIIPRPAGFPAAAIPADNPMTEEGVELGRHLFYEKMLSIDNSISCGSCHMQEFSFSDTAQFSRGVNGGITSRNSMSLANVVFDNRFFWDGRASTLEEQALIPIQDHGEMGITLEQLRTRLQSSAKYPPMFKKAFGTDVVTEENVGKAIGQFVRSLVSYNSKYDKRRRHEIGELTPLEQQGLALFGTHPGGNVRGGDCMDCHALPLTSNGLFKNNGLDVQPDSGLARVSNLPNDLGTFKTVNLRNIELTAPYMHDGRFKTLQEVLDHYSDHVATNSPNLAAHFSVDRNPNGQLNLTQHEKDAIIAFLKTLTDQQFLTDPSFSDPNQ